MDKIKFPPIIYGLIVLTPIIMLFENCDEEKEKKRLDEIKIQSLKYLINQKAIDLKKVEENKDKIYRYAYDYNLSKNSLLKLQEKYSYLKDDKTDYMTNHPDINPHSRYYYDQLTIMMNSTRYMELNEYEEIIKNYSIRDKSINERYGSKDYYKLIFNEELYSKHLNDMLNNVSFYHNNNYLKYEKFFFEKKIIND